MTDPRTEIWSVLGSSLWLRPVRSADQPRLGAFLARRDQARSRSADPGNVARLLREGPDPRRPVPPLVATDPFGAPAGFFAVHTGLGDGPPELCFVVPADAPGVLREALRLLGDALARHAGLGGILLRVEPGTFDGVLQETGWCESEPGVWQLRFREPVAQGAPGAD